uniref:Ran GTPase-activating protein 1 n=1 Tax=Chromera velia CCMP2878 TaxID=1169474 RepID=A0A0G4I7Z1_9ALVE|eukprot:Cvel_11714.t1-p1 / transcript=Cvel_11714.t1 / gene=Cvel_11714 / organism=Chromera_velia_CCMP2878 / gene_product=Protein NLRC3, putative / transcript_product=Protein NLRC3, putative / location=Cvel_scaffold743:38148-39272(-) / protein_length=375 / sequence_SO=supercontig / SO=protein_coding / is_pseudo=false
MRTEGAGALLRALRECSLPHLKTLSVEDNILGAQVKGELRDVVGVQAGGAGGRDGEESGEGARKSGLQLEEALRSFLWLFFLRTLHLSAQEMGDKGVKLLSRGLQAGRIPSLRVLSLRSSSISEEGAKVFAEALQTHCLPFLESLDLSSNRSIGDKGMVALAGAAKGRAMRSVQILDLSITGIREEGAVALADALKGRAIPFLRTLGMYCNEAGDEGVGGLAEAAKAGALRCLQSLDLSWNYVRSGGAKAIAGVLREGGFRYLQKLDLADNEIWDDGVEAHAEVLKGGFGGSLKEVILRENDFGSEAGEVLRASAPLGCTLLLKFDEEGEEEKGIERLRGMDEENSYGENGDFEMAGDSGVDESDLSGWTDRMRA